MLAGSLHCPTCGAAVTSGADHCAYCRGLLMTVACSRCRGMMFLGCKYCPHCGAAGAPIVMGQEQSTSCPRCDRHLVSIRLANDNMQQCPGCGGLWMSIQTFDHICSDSEGQSAASCMALPPAPPVKPEVVYIKCPECADLMARTRYAHASSVLINTCRRHGIWLDRDELSRIVEFIRSGGLERARRLEMEQLDAKRRALEFERRLDKAENRFRPRGYDVD